MASRSMTILKSELPQVRSSPCPPFPLRVMPTVHHIIRTIVRIARNSRANMNTGSSRVVSGTICRRKLRRHSRKPSSTLTAFDRRSHPIIGEALIMKAHQVALSAILAFAIGAFVVAFAEERNAVQQTTPKTVQLRIEGEFPSLGGATEWLNSPPLTAAGLRGKVVLIDFWTYSCINWRRSLPYVRAWAEKYKNQGLVVIGVHSPEFEFEKDVDNVRWAAKDMRIDYPIAIDSDQTIWGAFKNDYWPALYFIDAQGQIRHHQFGEGEYEKAEGIIQQLLAEAEVSGIGHGLVSVDG